MKRCPYCAEDIQDSAVKCRYCGEWLNGDDSNSSSRNSPSVESSAETSQSDVNTAQAPVSGSLNKKDDTGIWKKVAIAASLFGLVVVMLSVKSLVKLSDRHEIEQTSSSLEAEFPWFSKSDIALLSTEVNQRHLSPEQAGQFGAERMRRGVTLLSESEQNEITKIRSQMLSGLSSSDQQRWTSAEEKVRAGGSLSGEEIKEIEDLPGKAFGSLPQPVKLRFQSLMGRALRAGLNSQP